MCKPERRWSQRTRWWISGLMSLLRIWALLRKIRNWASLTHPHHYSGNLLGAPCELPSPLQLGALPQWSSCPTLCPSPPESTEVIRPREESIPTRLWLIFVTRWCQTISVYFSNALAAYYLFPQCKHCEICFLLMTKEHYNYRQKTSVDTKPASKPHHSLTSQSLSYFVLWKGPHPLSSLYFLWD